METQGHTLWNRHFLGGSSVLPRAESFVRMRVLFFFSTYYSYSYSQIVDPDYSALFDIRQIFPTRTSLFESDVNLVSSVYLWSPWCDYLWFQLTVRLTWALPWTTALPHLDLVLALPGPLVSESLPSAWDLTSELTGKWGLSMLEVDLKDLWVYFLICNEFWIWYWIWYWWHFLNCPVLKSV